MGSPVSPVVANFYMEFLEQQAITTAPIHCKNRLWKRYVDDILEIVHQDQVDNLTAHLYQTDPTDSIKFTYEQEHDGTLPFLGTLIVRKPDGSVKLLVYRKATHTDQYLNFSSHHPIHHKLGVVRTLLDRSNSVVTEAKDRELEEEKSNWLSNAVAILTGLSIKSNRKWIISRLRSALRRKKNLRKQRTCYYSLCWKFNRESYARLP